MQYDPIKSSLGKVFNASPKLRILFYKMLNLLLLRTWHIKREINLVSSSLPRNAEILDAGSGFGQYSYYLAKKFKSSKITGVDVKEEQIADCNSFFGRLGLSGRVIFREADLTKFREEEKYSLVLSIDVMEHILEDVEVFKNFCYSMKPGAVLLISTPSDQGGSDVHDEHDESFISEHVRDGYNINEISEKLKSAGFSQVYARYSYGKPGGISWKLSMKYPIIMLNKSKAFFILIPFYYLLTFPVSLVLNYFDVRLQHKRGTGLIVKAFK
jgi:2-polyprenyl-3-methyl-5-hydroxy-6-metoxy-1,4-benzoquinol methylase